MLLTQTLLLRSNVQRHPHMQSGLCYANIIRDGKQTKDKKKYGTRKKNFTPSMTIFVLNDHQN